MKKEVEEHLKELYLEKKLLEAYELKQKNMYLALFLGFLFSPIAYAYIKKWEYVFISTLTLNYFLLGGFFIGPLHIYYLFSKAEEMLE